MSNEKTTLELYREKRDKLMPVKDKVARAIDYALGYGIGQDWTGLNAVKILTKSHVQIRMTAGHVFISDFNGMDTQLKVTETKYDWNIATHIRHGYILNIYPSGEQSTENIRLALGDIKYIGLITFDMLEYDNLYSNDD